MQLNEGIIRSDATILVKSEMIRQLARLEATTPDLWERAVFESLTGHKREDVDWSIEDNQAGYYTWVRSFDQLITELRDDGYLQVEELGQNQKVLKKTDWDPTIDYSRFVYSPRTPA